VNVPLIAGISILAAVFLGIFITMARISGWRTAAVTWAGTLVMVAVIGLGVALIQVGLS
jgi:hypothetical protein